MTGEFVANGTQNEEFYDVGSLGEGLKLLSSRTEELNHSLSEDILSTNEFDGDRDLSSAHVKSLVNHMQRGTFRSELVNIIQCRCAESCKNSVGEIVSGGATWRLNGQHTAWARLEMPPSYRCPVTVRRYSAKTEYDMRQLYTSIDRGKARSRVSQSYAIMAGVDDLKKYHKSHLRYIDSGFSMWKWESRDERRTHDSNDTVYVMIADHVKTACHVLDEISCRPTNTHKFLLRQPIVAAMFATYDKAVAPSREFWGAVTDGVGFSTASDPRNRLRLKLLQYSLNATQVNNHRVTDSETMHRWCLNAWNLWRGGETVNNIRSIKARPKMK